MTNKTDSFDQEISYRVQAVEHQIPQAVEQAFMDALQKIEPDFPKTAITKSKPRLLWQGGLLAAATILLAVVMLMVYMALQHHHPKPAQLVEADEVPVQDCYVDGQPASTLVLNPADSNMTIVWVEKIKNLE